MSDRSDNPDSPGKADNPYHPDNPGDACAPPHFAVGSLCITPNVLPSVSLKYAR